MVSDVWPGFLVFTFIIWVDSEEKDVCLVKMFCPITSVYLPLKLLFLTAWLNQYYTCTFWWYFLCHDDLWPLGEVFISLNLILLKPKVISLCHQYKARPDFTSGQSDQALYCWLLIFLSLKMIMNNSKIERWNISFKKFSRLRVNIQMYSRYTCTSHRNQRR